MAQEGRTQLKTYFETGDKPTQVEFANKIDSSYNLVDDNSDDISEGSSKLFVTPAQRAKIENISEVAAATLDTGALTAGFEKTVLHSLDLDVSTVVLVARNDSDTNNVQVAGLRAIDADNIGVKSNVNLTNLKVKLIGIKN